jgi:hypothetical protein
MDRSLRYWFSMTGAVLFGILGLVFLVAGVGVIAGLWIEGHPWWTLLVGSIVGLGIAGVGVFMLGAALGDGVDSWRTGTPDAIAAQAAENARTRQEARDRRRKEVREQEEWEKRRQKDHTPTHTSGPLVPLCVRCGKYIDLGDEVIVVRMKRETTARLRVNPATESGLHTEQWLGDDSPTAYHASCYGKLRERFGEELPWLPPLGEVPESL